MARDTDVDVFAVATACEHIPNGDIALNVVGAAGLEKLPPALRGQKRTYLAVCASHGIPKMAALELWYWFHPDDFDDNTFSTLRERADTTPPLL